MTFDDKIDPEIRGTLALLNGLGFLETLYSCAGYGISGVSGKKHDERDVPYITVHYDEGSLLSGQFHLEMSKISRDTTWWPDSGSFSYYCPGNWHAQGRRWWRKIRTLAELED